MKRPRDLKGIDLAKALCRDWDYRIVHQEGSQFVRYTLTSTDTARGFYQTNGYVEDGPLVGKLGMRSGDPMSKHLAPRDS